jgi:hypothetical protein
LFFLAGVVGFALDRGQLSEMSKLILEITVLLGPLAVNSVLLLKHEMTLNAASAIKTS